MMLACRYRAASIGLRGCLGLVLALTACAGGSGRITSTTDSENLPRPSMAFVYPFAVDADDAAADTFGYDHRSSNTEGHQVASALADKVVAALRDRGIPAQRALPSTTPRLHAVVLKGQFVTIDKGSRGERVIIGFSAGSEDVRVRAQAYQVTETGLYQLQTGEVEAHGRKTPGVAVPGIVSIATANPAAVVISSGINVASEVVDNFDSRLDDIAAKLADNGRDFYARNGWL